MLLTRPELATHAHQFKHVLQYVLQYALQYTHHMHHTAHHQLLTQHMYHLIPVIIIMAAAESVTLIYIQDAEIEPSAFIISAV